jgi:hypothetical protein
MTTRTKLLILAAAVVIAALAWVDPLFIPLITLGPIVSGAVAGVRGVPPRHVALSWFGGGLLMLLSDLVINHEDVAFHAVIAIFTAALAAGATALTRRLRGRSTATVAVR